MPAAIEQATDQALANGSANEAEPDWLRNLRQWRHLTRNVRNEWGGWGSNPGPADYESAALTG